MKKHPLFFIICLVLISCTFMPAYAVDTTINGFVSQGYLQTDKNNWLADTEDGSFEFNDMALRFSSRLTHRLYIGMQLYARDLGDLGNDEITLDWFKGDYYYNRMFGFRVGRMKVPHGLYNESRDSDFLRTSIFLPFSVYPEQWRDSFIGNKGLGIYGEFFERLSYNLQIGVLDADPDCGMAKSYNGMVGAIITDVRPETCYIGNLQCRIIDGLRAGFSIMYWTYEFDMTMTPQPFLPLPSDTPGMTEALDDVRVYSLEYIYKNLTISGEYMRFLIDFDMNVYLTPLTIERQMKSYMEGYYGNIEYRFTDWLAAGVYYSIWYLDEDDKDGANQSRYGLPDHTGWSKDACISTRFDINDNWIAKLEVHFNDGTCNTYVSDNRKDDGTIDLERYWTAFAAKVMYNF